MKVHYIAQRSDVWRQLRCGVFTASRSQDVLARGRHGVESASRRHYRRQLVCEELTRIPEDRAFQSRAMRRGRELEAAARAAYSAHTGLAVETSGFVMHDELRAGCSLDGHVGAFEGVIEIKVPNTVTHLRYLLTRRVPRRYLSQITHHLWITGARWCDFVSYDDRLPARMQLLVVRVSRDDVDVAGYEREAVRFLDEVRAVVEPLAAMRPLEFFRSAPYDVARHVLSLSHAAVDARRHERSTPSAWQPVLGGVR